MPKINRPGESTDFHDSSLVEFQVSPHLDAISIVVSTPDEKRIERMWRIDFEGVLRLEYETLGSREESYRSPLEIYDIYNDADSDERRRWVERLKLLGVVPERAETAYHIVLASSFVRGWGAREHLEGINIVCRNVTIRQADGRYAPLAYSRPRINAGNE